MLLKARADTNLLRFPERHNRGYRQIVHFSWMEDAPARQLVNFMIR